MSRPDDYFEYDLRVEREKAAARDARMNEPMTRGAILEAIDRIMHIVDNDYAVQVLRLLREVFE